MQVVSKKAEYAIFLLAHLAAHQEDQPIPAREIAREQGLPENIMAQLSALLGRKNWIEGRRGAGGGLTLVEDPDQITIMDVIEAVEGPVGVTGCLLREGVCPNQGHCALHRVLSRAQDELFQVLSSVSIRELGEQIGSR